MKRSAGRPAAEQKGQRLQKVLALAGLGSRRQCEELIVTGRVEIDGQTVTELGTRVDPARSHVRVDGVSLRKPRLVYYAVNKPVGVVSTNADPAGRTRVVDLVPEVRERLFTVGRLDKSSEGLMLVTNDGELANRLAHPRYGIHKTYLAVVAGEPSLEMLDNLRKGVRLAEGVARVVSVSVRTRHKQSTQLEIVLAEGKNREIRRILAKVGHKVLQLRRVALGPLKLGMMAPGESRRLEFAEIERLQAVAHGRPPRSRQRAARPAASAAKGDRRPPKRSKPDRPALKQPAEKSRTIIGEVAPAAERGVRPKGVRRRPSGRPMRRKPGRK